jgi:hypothetical protein
VRKRAAANGYSRIICREVISYLDAVRGYGSVLLEKDEPDCHSDLKEDYAAIETG